jgi:hypothetical protein
MLAVLDGEGSDPSPIMPFSALERIYDTNAPTCSPKDVTQRAKGCVPTSAPTDKPTVPPTIGDRDPDMVTDDDFAEGFN